MKIRSPEDFWSGIMFITFGVAAIVVSRDYPLGSAMRMGPGYFPTAIGLCLVAMGTLVSALSTRTVGQGIGAWPWRAILMMSVAFSLFAWGLERIGFIASLALLIVVSTLSTPHFRWKEMVAEVVFLVFGAWALFIYGLGMTFPLWGR